MMNIPTGLSLILQGLLVVDKLAIDLGGMLFVDVVDAAMGGAIGGPIGEGFAIVGINTTDLVAIVDALAKYRWCKRTGVFL